ncbi:hypothetical protein BJ322DRAFT_1109335 [Thelephora terrestris]|uniref:Uncharacterized protein n=1 Tax=Thelephora terrestris TaxID=56493 RepID=A0A9P6HF73_9AGAM|nr:hypothetical protein BJ322DRAFT_1109335 [Thelephora terrestris]
MPRRRRSSSSSNNEEDRSRSTQGGRRQQSVSRVHRRRDARSSPEAESTSEVIVGERSKKKRTEYTPVEEKLRITGRGFGIFYEMWRPYSSIIDKGLEASAADPSALPEADQPYVNAFRDLLAFSTTVKSEIVKEESDKEKIGTLLDTARGDTKRSHASAVKISIGDWHHFSPGLSKKSSSPRGWDHDECARLLCPPTIEWNEANKQGLRDPVTRKQFELGPGEFPRFLWAGETMDDIDPTIGFLRHPILFAALRHFAISPSSGVDAGTNMSTKFRYARLCGIKHVTIESIAYAATMVRFGLSSDKRFSATTSFSYKDMYYNIINFTKAFSEAQVQQLLISWDREVFVSTRAGDGLENEDPEPNSLAARLTRQVELLRAQQSQ